MNPVHHQPRRTGEPRLASVASWAVLAASFGLSASTWIALARLAGFTDTTTVAGVTLAMAWLMPIAVDGYVVVALVLWMAPVPARVAAFARKNTYGAAGIGIAAQSAYHLLDTNANTDETWRVVLAAIVGALPPAVAGLAVHMRALIRRESSNDAAPANPVPATDPAVPATHAGPAIPAPAVPAAATDPTDSRPIDTDLTDPDPHMPAHPPTVPEIPTPAVVAARITKPCTADPAAPAPRRSAAPTRHPASRPAAPAPQLAPSATDVHVTEPDAAQPHPPAASPELVAKARQVARQYRTEHGTPITAGQLAVRLKVTSEQAAQALAVLNLAPDSPTRPIPTVNGNPAKAAR